MMSKIKKTCTANLNGLWFDRGGPLRGLRGPLGAKNSPKTLLGPKIESFGFRKLKFCR